MDPALDRSSRIVGERLHAISLHVGPRGNILVSFHYINQVISIAADWKSIEWRLGGVRPTVAVAPEHQTSAQHTAAEIEPNRILMFDNRTALQPPYSRAVEYVIEGDRATQVWEWRPPHDNYASAVSAARRLANGDRLGAFAVGNG